MKRKQSLKGHPIIRCCYSHLKALLHASVSALVKSSKVLILKFLVKCFRLHSVVKIPSKSHMLDIVLNSSVYYKCSYKL